MRPRVPTERNLGGTARAAEQGAPARRGITPRYRIAAAMNLVEGLRRLQATDSALDAHRERLARVQAELADRSELRAARQASAERTEARKRAEANQRDLDLEVQTLRGHLDAVEKKLYGGRIGDARELSNLTKEADHLRARIGSREDRLLELFEATDRSTSEQAQAETHLRDVERSRRSGEAALAAERDRLVADIQTEEAARASLREQTDPAALRTYDHLRRTRGGVAVAEVRQRTCQGCRVSLRASEEQRARQGTSLVICESCGRILYATF